MQSIENILVLENMGIICHFSYRCHTSAEEKLVESLLSVKLGTIEKKSILYNHYQICVFLYLFIFLLPVYVFHLFELL